MSATTVEIHVPLELPPAVVRDAAMHVLDAIGRGEGHYRNLTLSLSLRLPGGAHVSVPVRARVSSRAQRWEAGLHIEAVQGERFFPVFDGTVSVTPNGDREAELWMQGSYVPPGGALGEGVDATVMRGAAEASLRQFLGWLADETIHEVKRTERERLEQAQRYHG